MQSPAESFSVETVREVARLLDEANLSEITLETTGEGEPQRLLVRRGATFVAAPVLLDEAAASTEASATAVQGPGAGDAAPAANANHLTVTSTAVGLFRAAKPPLEVGDEVKKKALLGIVESMKIPTEIYAPQAGKVVEILVGEGQGIEWGQPLVVLEPLL